MATANRRAPLWHRDRAVRIPDVAARPADVVVAERQPPLQRSTVYVLRLLVGVVALLIGIVLLVVFEHALLGLRDDIGSIQASWPEWFIRAVDTTFGMILLLGIVATQAYLLTRRWFRRWAMVTTAALGAMLLGLLVSELVVAVATSDTLEAAIRTTPSERLGNLFLGPTVAVLTVASVWIGPRLRPWAIAYVLVTWTLSFEPGSLAPVMLPVDIGTGMFAGAGVALLFKTRDRTPSPSELAATLERGGLDVADVRRASVDARGSVPWFVRTVDGTQLFVKTLGADHRAADLLFRLYRLLRLRGAGDRPPFSSLRRAVEHEALLSLAAHARSIRTPQLVTVSDIGADGMLLAYRRIDGRSLDEVDPAAITDRLLADIWRLVAALRAVGIAHRDLRLANIFVGEDDVPWIIDFGFAELAAEPSLLARDDAELLASTAAVVGPERAVAVAADVLGKEQLSEAVPWIQPLALSSATRNQMGRSEAYEQLRAAAARILGLAEVRYERLERVQPATLLMLAAAVLTLYVFVPQLAAATGLADAVRTFAVPWIGVALAASVATYVGAGLGMVGAIPVRLPLRPMVAAQLASSFTNRLTPAKIGGLDTNVRFLVRRHIPMHVALSAVGLNALAGFVVHAIMLAAFGVAAAGTIDLAPLGTTIEIVLAAVIVPSLVFALLPVGRRLLTRFLLPAARAGAGSVAAIARTPTKLYALLLGSAIVTTGYTAAMLASLHAVGADLAVTTGAVVYLLGVAVASLAPTPGGLGAVEAVLVAGYTAVGVPATPALSAVLVFRLVTFWLPILPGWFARSRLHRAGQL